MNEARKKRRVCSLPRNNKYGPLGMRSGQSKDFINLSVDEYETIRLIDYEGYDQEECSKQMNVARTTVQGIYARARLKISKSLVEGKVLLIDGGNYELCTDYPRRCGRSCMKDRRF
ncbi:MAG: DUF134 domain-containing protein [Bacilli bacterium]|nr:DUF134 domain-containing protein [Bacilli bacterium]